MRISLTAALLLALLLSFAPSGRSRAQDEKKSDDNQKQVARLQDGEDNEPEPRETKYIRPDKKAFKKQDKLTVNSEKDAGRNGALSQTYVMMLDKGKTYQFDLRSTAFDAFLRILDPNGNQIAYNDDFPGQGLNSRIILSVATKGQYKVVASSLGGQGTGDYEIEAKVQ